MEISVSRTIISGNRVIIHESNMKIKGTVMCVHSPYYCVRRDDGREGGGCNGAWHVLPNNLSLMNQPVWDEAKNRK